MAGGASHPALGYAAPPPPSALSQQFESMAPIYLTLGLASLLGTIAVIAVSRRVRDHPSTIILIITVVDLLYTLKYMVGALAWLCGARDERDSFHLINDDCVSSLAYGQFMGMASISWNAVWIYDFLCVLYNPLRRTDGQRRWYHVYVWTLCVGTTIYVLAAGVAEDSNDHTCWVRADNADSLIFEIPLYAYMLLALFSLAYAVVRLRGCSRESGAWGWAWGTVCGRGACSGRSGGAWASWAAGSACCTRGPRIARGMLW